MVQEVQEPTVTQVRDSYRTTHPAYAQISASRIHGHVTLYGSDFNHQHSIRIRVTKSELERQLSRDWPMSGAEYIEVELSEAQWATFVSSLNMGGGVQCTLRHLNRVETPGLPNPKGKKELFKREFSEHMQRTQDDFAALSDLIDQAKLSDKAKAQLQNVIQRAHSGLNNSADFIAKQFAEYMEETVEKAKTEVHAYTNHAITSLGLDAIKAAQLQITNKEQE